MRCKTYVGHHAERGLMLMVLDTMFRLDIKVRPLIWGLGFGLMANPVQVGIQFTILCFQITVGYVTAEQRWSEREQQAYQALIKEVLFGPERAAEPAAPPLRAHDYKAHCNHPGSPHTHSGKCDQKDESYINTRAALNWKPRETDLN